MDAQLEKARLDKQSMMDLLEANPGFYGEWVYYKDEDEKKKAYEYLNLWKHFICKKLSKLEIYAEQFVDRPDIFGKGINTLGLKIGMK